MANTLKAIDPLMLTAAFQTVYTVPAATTFTISAIHIANVAGVAKTVEVCYVPPAGSPGITNALLWDFSIAENSYHEFGKGIIMEAGSSLRALASAINSCPLTLSGIEST